MMRRKQFSFFIPFKVHRSAAAANAGKVWMRPASAVSRPAPDKATLRDWIEAGIKNGSILAEFRIVWADEPAAGQMPSSQLQPESNSTSEATELSGGHAKSVQDEGSAADSTKAALPAT